MDKVEIIEGNTKLMENWISDFTNATNALIQNVKDISEKLVTNY